MIAPGHEVRSAEVRGRIPRIGSDVQTVAHQKIVWLGIARKELRDGGINADALRVVCTKVVTRHAVDIARGSAVANTGPKLTSVWVDQPCGVLCNRRAVQDERIARI